MGTDSEPGALYLTPSVRLTHSADAPQWGGLFFDAAANLAQTRIRDITIEYAGKETVWYDHYWGGSINIYGNTLRIENCLIQFSMQHGVQMENASPTITDINFLSNGSSKTHYDILCSADSAPLIEHNNFGPPVRRATLCGASRAPVCRRYAREHL